MEPASSALTLISWQGWSVTGSITALLILLVTILLWLLPFPSNTVSDQLFDPSDREDLRSRFGAASAAARYLIAMRRFNDWLHRWFGNRWSAQAFERCVAIAFAFPVALFLLASVLSGYKSGQVGTGGVIIYIVSVIIAAVALRALFYLGYRFARRNWYLIGGDDEMADLIARILLGAFAVIFAFAIAFAVASSLAGEVAGVGTVAFAIVGGFAFAIAFATAFAFAGFWAFLIALVLVAVIALTMAKDFAFFLMLFFIILPLLNALMDWLSWAVTRFNVSLMDVATPSPGGVFFVTLVLIIDIAVAILFVLTLAILLPIGLETVDILLSTFGRESFEWRIAATQALNAPWDEGLFVTGMLLTPLVPSLAVLTIGFASLLMPLTPAASSVVDDLSDGEEAAETGEDETASISRIVYLSRLWYLPALIVSMAILVGIWGCFYLLEIPVANFLYDLAMCSTVWGHGQCAWLQ